jgi:hypothetical protein
MSSSSYGAVYFPPTENLPTFDVLVFRNAQDVTPYATNAGSVNITNTTSGATYYPTFVDTSSGFTNIRTNDPSYTYNANTNTISANTSGTAGVATQVTLSNTASGATNYLVMSATSSGTSSLLTDNSGATYDSTTNTAVINISGNSNTATTSTNIASGLGGSIPYQSALSTTALLANGTAGQLLQSNGTTLAPSWVTPAVVSTPNLSAVLVAGNSAGSTDINMNSQSITSANQITATQFNGALNGNANTATLATTATTATNALACSGNSATATLATTATTATNALACSGNSATATLATTATTATNALACSGNSATASQVNITNTTSGTTYYPTFVDANTGNEDVRTKSATLTYNATTDTLASTNFTGSLSGTASTATNALACSGNSATATLAATATNALACSGNSATATTASACSGNSATATTASACSGNSATATLAATATNALACSGNSATATTALACSGNSATATLATTATTATNALACSGNSATASQVNITNTTSGTTYYPTFVDANTGNEDVRTKSATLTYNATTDTLASTNFTGSLSGTASTATNALACSGNSATATTASACSGNSATATTATNIAGGLGGSIPYQSALSTTLLLANGTAGQLLQSNGTTLAPSWVAAPVIPATPNLSAVLVAGNSAGSTDINMNNNAISGVSTLAVSSTSTFGDTMDINIVSASTAKVGLNILDTTLSNNIRFIPSNTSGNFNPFANPDTSAIVSLNGAVGNQPLEIYPWSANTVGLRLTGTSALLGAGGTASFTPTSSISFAGTSATMTGDLNMNTGNITNATAMTATTFTGSLTGNASSATEVGVTVTTTGTWYPVFVNTQTTGNKALRNTTVGFNFDVGNQQFNTVKFNATGSGQVTGTFTMAGATPIITTNTANDLNIKTLATTGGNIVLASQGGAYGLTVSTTAFTSTLATTVQTANGNTSVPSFIIKDTMNIKFIPNCGLGSFNNFQVAGDSLIYCDGTAVNTGILSLSTWSSNTNGVKIKANEVLIGAGGTASTPTSSIKFDGSGSTMTLNGDVVMQTKTFLVGGVNLAIGSGASTVNNNVMIGVSAPYTQTFSIGFNSLYGCQAGTGLSSTAAYNTLIGYAAGAGQTSGTYNTFLGHKSGFQSLSLGTGSYNTCVGNQAGEAMTTTAQANTFLGNAAGFTTTTGQWNTSLGTNSGLTISSSSFNTFVGGEAANGSYANPLTGSNNVAVGYRSAYNMITTANQNTFLGTNAGYGNTSGFSNVFIGFTSGYQAGGTSSQNVCVGVYAGDSMTGAASGNTLLGYEAGAGISTGSNNTIIGSQAGTSVTGQNNIVIGQGAQVPTPAADRQIAIGTDQTALFIQGQLSLKIYGTIVINTTLTAPMSQFYIVTMASATRVITLPNPTDANISGCYVIFKRKGNTTAFNISAPGNGIMPIGSITALATLPVTTSIFQVNLVCDGTHWSVIGQA